ncbi:hypothetical protein GJ744_005415 [Endocarpon pusillum]|uniref:Uncharacterized protein n=1 Tax=Endocarpon pusillum TaxID=364733 RepID=A0A8H7ACB8_9EURO|nr:hypothetical protein GJ744_005415 [Endocarpon pusillum]
MRATFLVFSTWKRGHIRVFRLVGHAHLNPQATFGTSAPNPDDELVPRANRTRLSVVKAFGMLTREEKKNTAIYIVGIMLYKFGLEAFNGSITAVATNRYDNDARIAGVPANTFERVGLLQGLNQAFQCVGSILIAPLIKRFPTKLVLAVAVFCFGILTAILMIVDGTTGGRLKPGGAEADGFSYYGSYNTDGIIPIFCFTGIAYGMAELIRRVIPRDIVGGNVQKLRRMDAMVHIFYEVSGTAGAFCTALGLIPALGNSFSFIITPICITLAAITVNHLVFRVKSQFTTSHLRPCCGGQTFLSEERADVLRSFLPIRLYW